MRSLPAALLLLVLTSPLGCRGSTPSAATGGAASGDAVSTLPAIDDLWNFEEPAATESAFRGLLATHGEAPAAWRLELQTQIARTLGLQKRFDEGRALLDAVDRAPDVTPRVAVRSTLERGRIANSAGDRSAARPLFEAAFARAQAAALDGLAVDAAHMVAIAASGTEDELLWGDRALALAESSPDPAAQKWRGSLLNNIGWSRHDRGELDVALALWQRAVIERERVGAEPALRIARWTVARGLRSLGRHADAIAALQAIVATYGETATGDGFVQEELAENQLALGVPEATQSFASAHRALASSWIPAEEPARYLRIAQLGGLAPVPADATEPSDAQPPAAPSDDEEPQE